MELGSQMLSMNSDSVPDSGQITSLTQFPHLSSKVIIILTHWVIWGFNGVIDVKSFYK